MPRQLLIRGSLLLLFPSFLTAQHRAAMVSAPVPSVARPVSGPAPAHAVAHRTSAGLTSRSVAADHRTMSTSSRPHHSRSQFSSNGLDDQSSDFPVPGLGFDAVHFAAIHPNVSNHRHRASNSAFIPLYGGEYFYPYPVAEENAPQTGTEEDDYVSYDDRPVRRQRPAEFAPASNPVPQQTFEPSRAPDEYIFVRRDGTVFFAVAYSWDRNTLRYVTQQGLRQSLSSDALDFDATHRFNEQRGLAFRPPA